MVSVSARFSARRASTISSTILTGKEEYQPVRIGTIEGLTPYRHSRVCAGLLGTMPNAFEDRAGHQTRTLPCAYFISCCVKYVIASAEVNDTSAMFAPEPCPPSVTS